AGDPAEVMLARIGRSFGKQAVETVRRNPAHHRTFLAGCSGIAAVHQTIRILHRETAVIVKSPTDAVTLDAEACRGALCGRCCTAVGSCQTRSLNLSCCCSPNPTCRCRISVDSVNLRGTHNDGPGRQRLWNRAASL